jgi:hypothetical protein
MVDLMGKNRAEQMDETAAATTGHRKAWKMGNAVAACLANGWVAAMDKL